MSTYGKKALENWDYDNIDMLRFYHTPKPTQLAILKKWYPIGETFYVEFSQETHKISEYLEFGAGFLIGIDDGRGFGIHKIKFKINRMLRNKKIDIILNKKGEN